MPFAPSSSSIKSWRTPAVLLASAVINLPIVERPVARPATMGAAA
jgi:hypothetical protein